MGIDYHVFVGAYFECETKEIDVELTRNGCPTVTCSKFHKDNNAKYCPECGKGIIPLAYYQKGDVVDQSDVSEKLDDALVPRWIDETLSAYGTVLHRYMSNKSRSCGLSFDTRERSSFALELKQDTINADILALKKTHPLEQKLLEDAYGKDKVKIKWGIVYNVG